MWHTWEGREMYRGFWLVSFSRKKLFGILWLIWVYDIRGLKKQNSRSQAKEKSATCL